MVCADGLRVCRSFRNWENHSGIGSTSAASVSAPKRTEGVARAGVGAVGHILNCGR